MTMLKTVIASLAFLMLFSGILGSFVLVQRTGGKQTQKVEQIMQSRNLSTESRLNNDEKKDLD